MIHILQSTYWKNSFSELDQFSWKSRSQSVLRCHLPNNTLHNKRSSSCRGKCTAIRLLQHIQAHRCPWLANVMLINGRFLMCDPLKFKLQNKGVQQWNCVFSNETNLFCLWTPSMMLIGAKWLVSHLHKLNNISAQNLSLPWPSCLYRHNNHARHCRSRLCAVLL